MIKRRTDIILHELIRTSKVEKRKIAKSMGISPQWLSALLAKDPDDLTINQLRSIVQAIGLELIVSVEVRV
jgi:predicted XRE-type DNA-binding protein